MIIIKDIDIKVNNIIFNNLKSNWINLKTKFEKPIYINFNYDLQYYRILCIYKYIEGFDNYIIQYILSFIEFPKYTEKINKKSFYNLMPLIELPLIKLKYCDFILNSKDDLNIKLNLSSLTNFDKFIKQIDIKFSSSKFKFLYFNKESKIPIYKNLYKKSIENNKNSYIDIPFNFCTKMYFKEKINRINILIDLKKYILLSSKIKIYIKLSQLWYNYDKHEYGMTFEINKIILNDI